MRHVAKVHTFQMHGEMIFLGQPLHEAPCRLARRRSSFVLVRVGRVRAVQRRKGGLDLLGHLTVKMAPATVGRHDGEPADPDDAEKRHKQFQIQSVSPARNRKRGF